MYILRFPLLLLLVAALGLAPELRAQERGTIELKLEAEKEVVVETEDGDEEIVRQPADKVVPGDTIVYTITYTNVGEEVAENVAVANPIPQYMVYREDSAGGENAQVKFSIDGGRNFDFPANLVVEDEDGNRRQAQADEYTNIQWVLTEPVEPGAGGTVFYKTRLL